MRRRFFFLVFGILITTIVIVSSLQFIFFENERLRLIDQRLETIASTLIASGLSLELVHNLESTDDLISDLLGEERVDLIINIYSTDGEVLAHNLTADQIPVSFFADQWRTVEIDDRSIRVLNLKSGNLVIQVGMVLAPSIMNRWGIFNWRLAGFLTVIIFLLGVAAYFGSKLIFSPLRKISTDIAALSGQLERKMGQPLTEFVVGPEMQRLMPHKGASQDEFQTLLKELQLFVNNLANYTRSFHGQTAILTHELKTPLAVLRNYLAELQRSPSGSENKDLVERCIREIDQMARLINGYLQWSVLTSHPGPIEEIHALNLKEICSKVASDLTIAHGDRIQLDFKNEVKVFALTDHIQQLVSNLLGNALNYSEGKVICRIEGSNLVVSDSGPGIPPSVLEHLGGPFNRGPGRKSNGSGLGLAWITSLSEKYHWQLNVQSTPTGTTMTVTFPS